MAQDTDKVNELFEKYKEKFVGALHNVLWKLLVDKVRANSKSAFVSNYTSHGLELGIADFGKNGYSPTATHFADGITYDEAERILDDLNKEVFNLDDESSIEIVLSSMAR